MGYRQRWQRPAGPAETPGPVRPRHPICPADEIRDFLKQHDAAQKPKPSPRGRRATPVAHHRSRVTKLASDSPSESKDDAARQDAASRRIGFGGHALSRNRRGGTRYRRLAKRRWSCALSTDNQDPETRPQCGRRRRPTPPARLALALDRASHRRMISSRLRRLLTPAAS